MNQYYGHVYEYRKLALFFLISTFKVSKKILFYYFFSLILILFSFFKLFIFDSTIFNEFILTFVLFVFSLFFHFTFICSTSNFNLINVYYIKLSIYFIFGFSVAQIVTFTIFNSTILFNIFGSFSYTNQYNLEAIENGLLRINAFYLEPSFLAFVVINLFLFLMLSKKLRLYEIVLVSLILGLCGSRGGFIFFSFLIIYYLLFFNSFNLKIKFLIFSIFIFFISSVILFTDSFSILSPTNLTLENSSQFDRIYLGYLFCEYVLINYPLGIPFGQLEFFFIEFIGKGSSIFSFFYLVIIYFGYVGFLLFFIFIILIIFNNSFKDFILIFLYVLMYFNLTGSLLAPDTYFFGCIFILFFKKYLHEKSI
jgi:hypothetical protein